MDDEDIESTEKNIEEQVKKLKERLKICQKEKNEYLDGWQRSRADFINARRDEEKRIENSLHYAKAEILREFLTLIDSVDMAKKHKESDELAQIDRQFSEILKRQEIRPIECVGELFSPELHEALMQIDVDSEDKDNRVIEELQKGYMINDKVLRPSKVKVGIYKQ